MMLVCSACHYIGPKHFIYLGTVTKREHTFMDGEPLAESTELYACPECGTLRVALVRVGER